MAHARTYAKLVTANGEYEMTHRELDELRMLLSVSLRTDTLPQADPPIIERHYEELMAWIDDTFEQDRNGDTKYLD